MINIYGKRDNFMVRKLSPKMMKKIRWKTKNKVGNCDCHWALSLGIPEKKLIFEKCSVAEKYAVRASSPWILFKL